MKFKSNLGALLISVTALSLSSTAVQAAGADSAKTKETFTLAMSEYKAGHWSGAYGRFAWLGDRGHQESARIALFMLRHGATLYSSEWSASNVQVAQWTKLSTGTVKPMTMVSGD